MPHHLRSTELGVLQRSKHVETAVSPSSKVAKNRLCVAMRRASFQTRSTGASCGLYGGRKSRVSTARDGRSQGLSRTAWWYRALSSTITMRVPWERCRRRVFRKVSNVAALNVAHTQLHPVAPAKMRREQLAVPQMTGMTELLRLASHVSSQRRPLLGVQRGRPTRTSPVAQAGQSMGFETVHPSRHRPPIFPKPFGDLLAAVAAGDQQQPVQPMVVPLKSVYVKKFVKLVEEGVGE